MALSNSSKPGSSPASPAAPTLPPRINRDLPVINWQEENRRHAYMEWLYHRSGRRCGTYTGLVAERARELIAQDMAASEAHPLRLSNGRRLRIDDLDLPTSVRHAILRAGYVHVDELEPLDDAALLRIKQLGPLGLTQLRAALQALQ